MEDRMARKLLMLTLCILFLNALVAQAQDDAVSATVYQTVNVRSGPDTQYEIIGQLAEGDVVLVTGRDGAASRWLRVQLPDGQIGWVPNFVLIFDADINALPEISNEQPGNSSDNSTVTVTAFGQVNVRSGPGISHDIIGQLDLADAAQVFARSSAGNDWLYIETEELSGWVAYFTVHVSGDTSVLPVRVPDGSGQALVPPATLIDTRFNTRLHTEPTLDSPTLGLVPFDSPVTPLAKTEDSEWLYVAFGDFSGWAVTDLFVVSQEQLDAIPVYSPDMPLSPQSTQSSDKASFGAQEVRNDNDSPPPAVLDSTPEATPEPTAEATVASD
jgi:uncharacterized protein YraI